MDTNEKDAETSMLGGPDENARFVFSLNQEKIKKEKQLLDGQKVKVERINITNKRS